MTKEVTDTDWKKLSIETEILDTLFEVIAPKWLFKIQELSSHLN